MRTSSKPGLPGESLKQEVYTGFEGGPSSEGDAT